jgi:hypothetical protein
MGNEESTTSLHELSLKNIILIFPPPVKQGKTVGTKESSPEGRVDLQENPNFKEINRQDIIYLPHWYKLLIPVISYSVTFDLSYLILYE